MNSIATHTDGWLARVGRALEILAATGARYGGLIPSILDRRSGGMLREIPEPIAGQRQHDRAPRGSNLLHDIDLLAAMDLLAERCGLRQHRDAADRYLHRFATHCTQTVSGLFPWGEHAYWDLEHDALGNANAFAGRTISRGAYHDHLREVPAWLWQRLYDADPRCVECFADGLRFHWKSGPLAHEYWRHAYIERPDIELPHEAVSRDFVRYSGFFILDWAFAYVKFGRQDFLGQLRRMLDYWWDRRHASGVCRNQSRDDRPGEPDPRNLTVCHTLSLAASLFSAADVLEAAGVEAQLAQTMRDRGTVYARGCLDAPHQPQAGRFVLVFDPATRHVAWGSGYGSPISVAQPANLMIHIHAAWPEPRLVEWAQAAARFMLDSPIPTDQNVLARDFGDALNLLVDLHERTGQGEWLDAAGRLGEQAMRLFFDEPLPRGATGIDWYEAQMGAGRLLQGLARAALVSDSASARQG